MGLFDGLNQQQNSANPMPAAPQQTQAAKPTMWDTNSKLFDLSADSLKQKQAQQANVQQLQTDPNGPNMANDPFGDALPRQPQAPQPSSGFKPGIDPSLMMMGNQQMQMNQMNQMQMNPMQMQQMAMMRQQQQMNMMQGARMQMGMNQQMNPMMNN